MILATMECHYSYFKSNHGAIFCCLYSCMMKLRTWTNLHSILDRSDLQFQHEHACLNEGSYSNFENISDYDKLLGLSSSSNTTKGFEPCPKQQASPTDPC